VDIDAEEVVDLAQIAHVELTIQRGDDAMEEGGVIGGE
jgi:hypothetical protein